MSTGTAFAATAVGGEQDFTDGEVLAGFAVFDEASASEAAPFDQFRGSDPNSPNFDEQFTLTSDPGPYASGDFTLGIFDHDSATAGSQLAYFGVDGVDLTALLDQALESRGGAQTEYNVYTIALPAEALAALADGSGTFRLALQGPTTASNGDTLLYNGAGLDFAQVDLVPGGTDNDGDGVSDSDDACADTDSGAVVNGDGCSIGQLAPCSGDWKNHGQYVRAVAQVSEQFREDGLITEEEKDATLEEAASFDCGR